MVQNNQFKQIFFLNLNNFEFIWYGNDISIGILLIVITINKNNKRPLFVFKLTILQDIGYKFVFKFQKVVNPLLAINQEFISGLFWFNIKVSLTARKQFNHS